MKRQFLLPSALGCVLMVCLLVVHATAMQGTSMSTVVDDANDRRVTQIDHTYGLPTMLRVSTSGPSEDEQQTVETRLDWGTIASVLIVAWCISMPIGRWVTGYVRRDGEFAGPRHQGWRHPAAIVGYVLAGCLLVGLVCAAVYERTLGAPVPFAEMVQGFVMILMIAAVPITVIVMIVRRWMYRSRVQQRGFAVEFASSQV